MGIQFFVLAGASTAIAFEKFIVALSWLSVDASERHQMYFLVCRFLHLLDVEWHGDRWDWFRTACDFACIVLIYSLQLLGIDKKGFDNSTFIR
jgi:hypothetical protein